MYALYLQAVDVLAADHWTVEWCVLLSYYCYLSSSDILHEIEMELK